MSIEIRSVTKNFGKHCALKNIDLSIPGGELVSLLGPSGSGKTTLLRIIAGLEAPDSGSILFHGEDATKQSARDRKVGFVFQNYALFRHMTVFENVAFGLKVKPRRDRLSKSGIRDKVFQLLKLVQIDWLVDHYPFQLSGGQRQRVALARALAVEPRVLLLDEPFGALDAKVRKELRRWLRRLHDEIHVTSVFVTHDQEEALEVSDIVVVMNEGQIEQVGAPDDVYDHPANPFVHGFLGGVSIHGLPASAYVRPHEIELSRKRNGVPGFYGVVKYIFRKGTTVHLELERDNGECVDVEIDRDSFRDLELKEGEKVHAVPGNSRVFSN
ncbi:MAG: sulfate ABC transporter ATP-binding protein [Nitrospirae bacterium]|nr:sulfate ABC transporter ATP-binding protein [Nitrospirota bacterium]